MATYFEIVDQWYANKKWQEYDFQKHIAQAYHEGFNGLLNAPTGSGKTYAMFITILAEALEKFYGFHLCEHLPRISEMHCKTPAIRWN